MCLIVGDATGLPNVELSVGIVGMLIDVFPSRVVHIVERSITDEANHPFKARS